MRSATARRLAKGAVFRMRHVCAVIQARQHRHTHTTRRHAGEPALALSPDCKVLAVREPCSRRVCLLSAADGFKEAVASLVPLPVCQALDNSSSSSSSTGTVGAAGSGSVGDGASEGVLRPDVVLSCSWSTDSRLLLVACKSSAVYLYDR
jgi:hypothetical protein